MIPAQNNIKISDEQSTALKREEALSFSPDLPSEKEISGQVHSLISRIK